MKIVTVRRTVSVYLRKGIAYVPTKARTEAGFYLTIEPVKIIPAVDINALQSAIVEAMRRGNPSVPTPPRNAFPKPVLPRHARVKSWKAFEKDAALWDISEHDGSYSITPCRKRVDRGFEEDLERVELLPPGTSLEVAVQRFVSFVQMALVVES